MSAYEQSWSTFLSIVPEEVQEEELLMMSLQELRDLMESLRIHPVDAARIEVQWKILQSTHGAVRGRNEAHAAAKLNARHRVLAEKYSQVIHEFERQNAARSPSPESPMRRLRLVEEEHMQQLIEDQKKVVRLEDQHLLTIREEMWQRSFQEERRRAEHAEAQAKELQLKRAAYDAASRQVAAPSLYGGRPTTGVLSPCRAEPASKEAFAVPRPTLKPRLSKRTRLGIAADTAFSDPNSCARQPHQSRRKAGRRACSPGGWGQQSTDEVVRKHVPARVDPVARTGNPSAMSPAPAHRKPATRQSERGEPPRTGNPNEMSHQPDTAPRGPTRRAHPLKNNVSHATDEYARHVPIPTYDAIERRQKGRNADLFDGFVPMSPHRITLPSRAARRVANAPAVSDPSQTGAVSPAVTGKAMVVPLAHDHGVMHPWVGPPEKFPVRPYRPQEEGIVPWSPAAPNSPRQQQHGRLRLNSPPSRPTSPSKRRQLAVPRDSGVMPGAAGW